MMHNEALFLIRRKLRTATTAPTNEAPLPWKSLAIPIQVTYRGDEPADRGACCPIGAAPTGRRMHEVDPELNPTRNWPFATHSLFPLFAVSFFIITVIL